MKRRSLLTSGALGLLTLNSPLQAAMDCYVRRPAGAQLFTVREALGGNTDRALGLLADTGVREVELYGLTGSEEMFGLSLQEFRNLLDAHGLIMSLSHIDGENVDSDAIARAADVLGIETVIMAVAPGLLSFGQYGIRANAMQTREEMIRLADQLNHLGREFRRQGLFFAYHNHHMEFMPVDDETPYDYLMWNTDPQLVRCELDIGWLALAGVDYLAYLNTLGPRVVSCHLKDFDGRRPADMTDFMGAASHLLPPGQGVVNFKEVLEIMDYHSIRHGFVEIDTTDTPLSDIEAGVRHLAMLRNC